MKTSVMTMTKAPHLPLTGEMRGILYPIACTAEGENIVSLFHQINLNDMLSGVEKCSGKSFKSQNTRALCLPSEYTEFQRRSKNGRTVSL